MLKPEDNNVPSVKKHYDMMKIDDFRIFGTSSVDGINRKIDARVQFVYRSHFPKLYVELV